MEKLWKRPLKTWEVLILGNMRNSPVKYAGVAIFLLQSLMAVLAPFLAPRDPEATGIPCQAPSADHLLGTNDLGQDVFSELIYAPGCPSSSDSSRAVCYGHVFSQGSIVTII